jgi:hypothetical protein
VNYSVIKIGGNIIDDETTLSSFLQSFAAIEGKEDTGTWRWKISNKTCRPVGHTSNNWLMAAG